MREQQPTYWQAGGGCLPYVWGYGYWTGPDGDLLCLEPSLTTRERAEALLAPMCDSLEEAKAAFDKYHKAQTPVLVYGHIPDDLSTEFWDITGWVWHTVLIDLAIAPLVRFLNVNGVRTLASCGGHGHELGDVSIAEWSVGKAESLGFEVGSASNGWPWAVRMPISLRSVIEPINGTLLCGEIA